MQVLLGKKVLLGITGSIAAYKAALLVRLLVKQGAIVRVIMTNAATQFITPLTLSTLSKNEVITQFFTQHEQLWHNHVELGLWADVFVIAPASGNTLAKMANGICDNVLLASYLSARCPVVLVPAMDVDMWHHPATQNNIATLQKYGNLIVPVENGELASGLFGAGRMAEPETIVHFLETRIFKKSLTTEVKLTFPSNVVTFLQNKKVLITAGPTHEPIDPVRFVGNHSTGRMGIALAEVAQQMGADSTLIIGATPLRPNNPAIQTISVQTAEEMYTATVPLFEQTDIAISAAAVADYTPVNPSQTKIKKKVQTTNNKNNDWLLSLKRTKDILKQLGKQKKAGQLLVGFALETNNELANAQRKLHAKNLDMIVLNSLRDSGAGFQHDTNKITILDKHGQTAVFPLKSKRAVAIDIFAYLARLANP